MRAVLRPFHPSEATDTYRAARAAGVTPECIRRWCDRDGIGRKIGGRYYVSRPALAMKLQSDDEALRLYHAGNRTSDAVRVYFERLRCLDALD